MLWDVTWKYPLLINDDGLVIGKDNGDSPEGVVLLDGTMTKKEFITMEQRWNELLLEEMDEQTDE